MWPWYCDIDIVTSILWPWYCDIDIVILILWYWYYDIDIVILILWARYCDIVISANTTETVEQRAVLIQLFFFISLGKNNRSPTKDETVKTTWNFSNTIRPQGLMDWSALNWYYNGLFNDLSKKETSCRDSWI